MAFSVASPALTAWAVPLADANPSPSRRRSSRRSGCSGHPLRPRHRGDRGAQSLAGALGQAATRRPSWARSSPSSSRSTRLRRGLRARRHAHSLANQAAGLRAGEEGLPSRREKPLQRQAWLRPRTGHRQAESAAVATMRSTAEPPIVLRRSLPARALVDARRPSHACLAAMSASPHASSSSKTSRPQELSTPWSVGLEAGWRLTSRWLRTPTPPSRPLVRVPLPVDGVELCRKLRAEGRSIPILLLGTSSSKTTSSRARGGADDYVPGPARAEFVVRVRSLLRRTGDLIRRLRGHLTSGSTSTRSRRTPRGAPS